MTRFIPWKKCFTSMTRRTWLIMLVAGLIVAAVVVTSAIMFAGRQPTENAIASVNGASLTHEVLDQLVITYRPYLSGIGDQEQSRKLVGLWIESQLLKQDGGKPIGDEKIRLYDPPGEEVLADGWAIARHDFETVKSSIADRKSIYEKRISALRGKAKIWIHPDFR